MYEMDVQVCMYCIHVYIHLHVVYTAHTYRISITIGDKGNNKYRFSWKPEAKYCIVERWYKLKKHCCFPYRLSFTLTEMLSPGMTWVFPTLGVRVPNAHRHLRSQNGNGWFFRGMLRLETCQSPFLCFYECWLKKIEGFNMIQWWNNME
jgi:hypothetical protein